MRAFLRWPKKPVQFIKNLGILLGLIIFSFASSAYAKATIRPIRDFISTQGQHLVPDGPVKGGELMFLSGFVWGTNSDYIFSVDYAGLDNRTLMLLGYPNIGTTFSGFILETPLPDGQVLDSIQVFTRNANAYVVDGTAYLTPGANQAPCSNGSFINIGNCPAVIGYNDVELANGVGKPILTNSLMDIELVNSGPNAPIPDLVDVTGNPPSSTSAYVESIRLLSSVEGPLRKGYGSAFGVPDGTPALATLNVIFDITKNIDNEIVTIKPLGR